MTNQAACELTREQVTRDFDHHALPPTPDVFESYRELREQCPVAWSEHHGGFWIVTDREGVGRVLRDHEHFSSQRDLLPGAGTTQHIPSVDMPPMIPAELDPPASLAFRRLINPLLSPNAVRELARRLGFWVDHFLDAAATKNACDLMYDFAAPVPAAFTIEWIGLPAEDAEQISVAFHDLLGHRPEHERARSAHRTLTRLWDLVHEQLERRLVEPLDDVLGYIVTQQVNGRPITVEEAHKIAHILIAGGIETTTTAVGQVIVHLDRHRKDRAALIADPELWSTAADEFLRRYPPVVYHARVVKRDAVLGGCPMARGDRVMAVEASACHDAREFDRPDEVDLTRFPNRHLAFGLGQHRCVGMHLARQEMRLMVRSLLERFPDYRLGDPVSYPDTATIAGWQALPAVLAP